MTRRSSLFATVAMIATPALATQGQFSEDGLKAELAGNELLAIAAQGAIWSAGGVEVTSPITAQKCFVVNEKRVFCSGDDGVYRPASGHFTMMWIDIPAMIAPDGTLRGRTPYEIEDFLNGGSQ
jgi:hypothetical protein